MYKNKKEYYIVEVLKYEALFFYRFCCLKIIVLTLF